MEISPDGKYMIATLKSIGSTGIWDLDSGKLLSEVKNSKIKTYFFSWAKI